jgi:hypothetical protein
LEPLEKENSGIRFGWVKQSVSNKRKGSTRELFEPFPHRPFLKAILKKTLQYIVYAIVLQPI